MCIIRISRSLVNVNLFRFEKVLKGSQSSLFLRNVQLSLFSVIPGLIFGVYIANGNVVLSNGFFHGYDKWTWATIWLQAGGGLVVALVVKYKSINQVCR
jgi:solute carrier family 35 (UDP-sugar transporter), member A1/2/3